MNIRTITPENVIQIHEKISIIYGKKSAVHGHWTHHSTVWTCALALLATEPATEIVPFFIPLVMHHVRKWKKFKQKYEFSGLCHDELSHQCTVIYGEKYRIFRLLYSLKCVWKYIFMQYWSTILFRISVQHFAGIFPKHYSRDEVLLFLAPVRKIIKIFTTLVRKKYDWICSVSLKDHPASMKLLVDFVLPSDSCSSLCRGLSSQYTT